MTVPDIIVQSYLKEKIVIQSVENMINSKNDMLLL